jgi:hypothetical protein
MLTSYLLFWGFCFWYTSCSLENKNAKYGESCPCPGHMQKVIVRTSAWLGWMEHYAQLFAISEDGRIELQIDGLEQLAPWLSCSVPDSFFQHLFLLLLSTMQNFRVATKCLNGKVYITPSPIGVGLHNPQPMKQSITPPEFCKTGQITPYNSFEKSQ